MLSQLRAAWALTNALAKSIKLAKDQTQRDSQQSYRAHEIAEMEAEKLKGPIEQMAREIKK